VVQPSAGESCAPGPSVGDVKLDGTTEAELTEAVYRGAGLVVAKAGTDEWPVLREVTGLQWRGREGAGAVCVEDSAIGPAGALWQPGGVALATSEAHPVARFSGACQSKKASTALALRPFGLGAAVTVGFDPSTAAPPTEASALLIGAIAYVTPETAFDPRGVVEVQLLVENQGPATTTRVRETLGSALAVEEILDGGTPYGNSGIEWTRAQNAGGSDLFRYFLRLPGQAGTYETTAEVMDMSAADPVPAGAWSLSVVVPEGEVEVMASAKALASALPTKGAPGAARRSILAALARVEANPGVSPADRERAISDLLGAAESGRSITYSEPNGLRLEIDRILGFWEARP